MRYSYIIESIEKVAITIKNRLRLLNQLEEEGNLTNLSLKMYNYFYD